MPIDHDRTPEEVVIQRIASSLHDGLPPDLEDVNHLQEFVYRLLSSEFSRPNKPGRGGLRQLFRSFGYQDDKIDQWLEFARLEDGQLRSKRLDHYAGSVTAVLVRREPLDLSDLHAARARGSDDGRLEQVRKKAAERCRTEHWLGYLPVAVRSGDFRSTGTNFVFRASVGGKLYKEDGTMAPKHVSLLTRTILFAFLETPRGFPLYWQTANDPQYRNIYEDDVFDRIPLERHKNSGTTREREPQDEMWLHRLLGSSDSMEAKLEAVASRLFLACRTCARFVGRRSNAKQSRCVKDRCTWDPLVVREAELVEYELEVARVRVKVCRGAGHIWPESGSSKCPADGCGSPPMLYHKQVSLELPVTYPRNADYEVFLRDFDV